MHLIKFIKNVLDTVSGKNAQLDREILRHAQIEYGKDWQHAYNRMKGEQNEKIC